MDLVCAAWVWCGEKGGCKNQFQECWLKHMVGIYVLVLSPERYVVMAAPSVTGPTMCTAGFSYASQRGAAQHCKPLCVKGDRAGAQAHPGIASPHKGNPSDPVFWTSGLFDPEAEQVEQQVINPNGDWFSTQTP